jgi:hypothetical protein
MDLVNILLLSTIVITLFMAFGITDQGIRSDASASELILSTFFIWAVIWVIGLIIWFVIMFFITPSTPVLSF